MYFDTHAHYDDDSFDGDRDEVLSSINRGGIDLIVNPGCNIISSRKALKISEKYPFIYAGVGFHPHDSKKMTSQSLSELEDLCKNSRVVAIGEIGLDYHYDNSPRKTQRERFREQMELARKVSLPVIIHEREASRDCLEIIRDFKDVLGVFHCYSGSIETAKTIIKQDWYLSFTGVVTYKNAKKSREVIKWMPQDRLMLETDSPYLSPEPVRGRRNSSLNLPYISEAIGSMIGKTAEEVSALTMGNGKRFFGININSH